MLSRIARYARQTISASFDATPTAPVTIGVVDELGAEVIASGTATVANPDGSYGFELLPAKTAALGRLTATWTDAAGVRLTTQHDVVGFHLIGIDRLREFEPLDDEVRYGDAKLALGRDIASYALERACNRAFAPKLARETVTARGGRTLPLAAGPTALTSITLDGEAVDLDGILLDPAGYLERPLGDWSYGGSYLVTYEHGEQAVDPRVSRAVGLIAADLLFGDALDGQGSGIPERATSLSTSDGTFSLVTAGMGSSFSLPEVNAVVQQWRLPS